MSKPMSLPKIDLAAVAKRVEALRILADLNKDAFSLSFGLDPSSYSKMLQSKKPLKSEHAFAISERWGVSMDYIYRGDLSKMDEAMRAKLIPILTSLDE